MIQQELSNFLRDRGIERAIENAERHHPDWKDHAIQYLKAYPFPEFMAENVRIWAHRNGLPEAPNHRAWGGVIVKAKKLGLIRHIRYQAVKNPNAHSTPASVWRKI